MRAEEKARFFALWEVALEGSGKTLSEEALLFYWRTLQAYDMAQIEQAMMAHLRDPRKGGFAPRPSDIVRHIEGDPEHAADRAWGRVLRALREVGSWSNVVFDDRTIHAALHDMGGWLRLCSSRKEDLPFRGQEFRRLYRGYRQNGMPPYPAVLYGAAFVRGDEPVMLGTADGCKEVYRGGYNGQRSKKRLAKGNRTGNFKVLRDLIDGQFADVPFSAMSNTKSGIPSDLGSA